jgi:ubiquinone/menaquinone biosynthesis C-methylase UbiE
MASKHIPGPMPYTKAHHLLNPLRSLILSPKKLMSRLDVRPNSKVLELGPGPGYFSPEVATAIPEGKLVLVDVQQEMLDMAKERLDKRGIGNVEYRQGDATSLPVESEFVDVGFLVAVLGEVPDRDACLREMHRVLKENGLLSITEFKLGDPHFISKNEMTRMVQSTGFRISARYGGIFHYTINFVKM